MTDSDERLSTLYRRTPRDEPGDASDRLIRAAARTALFSSRRRGLVPWAVAATLVVGVGVGWRVLQMAPNEFDARPQVEQVDALRVPARPPLADTESSADAAMPRATATEPAVRRMREAPTAWAVERRSVGAAAALSKEVPGDCGPDDPGDDATPTAWRGAIDAARRRGDSGAQRCLERRYRERFDAMDQ